MTETAKCGKAAGALIPRLGMYYACVLEPNHEGDCQRGGTCFKHGDYVGELCPHWPDCMPPLGEFLNPGLVREATASVALDSGDSGTRRCCNVCSGPYPCLEHGTDSTPSQEPSAPGPEHTVPEMAARDSLSTSESQVPAEILAWAYRYAKTDNDFTSADWDDYRCMQQAVRDALKKAGYEPR